MFDDIDNFDLDNYVDEIYENSGSFDNNLLMDDDVKIIRNEDDADDEEE